MTSESQDSSQGQKQIMDRNASEIAENTEQIIKLRCEYCSYTSSYKGNLQQHLKIHLGEKSYKCNQCDYAAFRNEHLKRHLRSTVERGMNVNTVVSRALIYGII